MTNKLWQASKKTIINSELFRFENYISKKLNTKFRINFDKIHKWSVKNVEDFWDFFWDFSKIKGVKGKNKIKKSKIFFKNLFLPNSKLNFAENLLSKNNNDKAVTFISENGFREERSWKDLNLNTHRIINFLVSVGIKKGDRVCVYMPNIIETVEAFLATSAIGAIWSSCSPDFGAKGVIERFSQIKPKILFITDKYFYNGKEINIINRLPEILKKIPSISQVIIVNYPGQKNLTNKNKFKKVKINFLKEIKNKKSLIINKFKKFDFEHELEFCIQVELRVSQNVFVTKLVGF